MVHSKSILTPMACDHTLSIREGQPLEDPTLYYSMVEALQYYTLNRLDFCFVVNKVCQFMHSSINVHW